MRPCFAFSCFFFFSCVWTVKSHDFVVQGTKNIVHALFTYCSYTVHRSHDTIHTFKNYFATVFSVLITISSIQADSKHASGLCFEENILCFVENLVGPMLLFIYFLVLSMGHTILFQLIFTFIYSIFNNKFLISVK